MSNPNAPSGHPLYLFLLENFGRPPNTPQMIYMYKNDRTGAPFVVIPLAAVSVVGLVAANES